MLGPCVRRSRGAEPVSEADLGEQDRSLGAGGQLLVAGKPGRCTGTEVGRGRRRLGAERRVEVDANGVEEGPEGDTLRLVPVRGVGDAPCVAFADTGDERSPALGCGRGGAAELVADDEPVSLQLGGEIGLGKNELLVADEPGGPTTGRRIGLELRLPGPRVDPEVGLEHEALPLRTDRGGGAADGCFRLSAGRGLLPLHLGGGERRHPAEAGDGDIDDPHRSELAERLTGCRTRVTSDATVLPSVGEVDAATGG